LAGIQTRPLSFIISFVQQQLSMLVTRDSNLFNSEKGTSKAQSLPLALSLQTILDKENLQSLANATIAKLCRVSEIYDLDVEKPKGTRGKQEFINNITTKIQQKVASFFYNPVFTLI
jgi:hypothetical protein